jgi:hypothetical protein
MYNHKSEKIESGRYRTAKENLKVCTKKYENYNDDK